MDISYDAFYVTMLQHWYERYCCRGMGKNHVTEENMVAMYPRPDALTPHLLVQNVIKVI